MPDNEFASGRLQSKQLFIEHIAERLEAMETGRTRLKAIAYRAHVKMLREALGAYPRNRLEQLLTSPHAALKEALFNRLFESTGHLPEAPSAAARHAIRREANRLFARLRQSRG